ncbi:MAG: hypothetical protein U0K79_08970 [Phascolarctobacterium sp.]|nr:hypothetical protein [Phascolarctobacterium sp.]
MAKNLIPEIAKMLGVEVGEEFTIENKDHKETVVLAADGFHVIQPNNVVGPDHGKLLSKVLQGLYDVVKKPWEPKEGEYFYYPDVKRKAVCRLPWDSQFFDFAMKALDMVYRTQEEAEAHLAEDYERLTGKPLSSR